MATVLRTGFQYTVLAAFPRGKAGPKEGTAASCFKSEVFKWKGEAGGLGQFGIQQKEKTKTNDLPFSGESILHFSMQLGH